MARGMPKWGVLLGKPATVGHNGSVASPSSIGSGFAPSPTARRALPVAPAVALLLAATLAGCSNNPNPEAWTKESTYFIAFDIEPQSFDPSVSYDSTDSGVLDLIYPTYFRYNFLKQNPWELELNLGLKEPTKTPLSGRHGMERGESWTLELRHNLRFQNDPCFPGGVGRAVTAKDLEYSFKRMADPKVEFPLAGNLADKVLGWDAYVKAFGRLGKANYDRPMEGVRLDPNNPYRLTVSMTRPYPQFRYLLAMHFTTPIPREAVERYGDDFAFHHPVGCGLFKLAEYSEHERIVLVRNPNCAGENFPTSAPPGTRPDLLADRGKPLPFVDRIEYRIITEPITSYNLFDQGYLDALGVAQSNSSVLLRAVKPGASMVKRGAVMLKGTYPAIEYVAFNMEDPTYGGYTPKKRKLRQAISLSIESEAYVDFMNQGLGVKSEFLLPRGIAGYEADYKNPYRAYDPKLTRAKELLAEAGYPNGIDPRSGERLTLYYDNYTDRGPADRLRENFIRKQIETLGIKVASRDTDYATFIDKTNHKKVQFFNLDWIADYPDAENFCMLLYGPNVSPGPNNANYRSPVYDKLFEQMRDMEDGPAREAIIRRLRDVAVEDCPWIYLCEDEGPTVFQPWVRNKQSNPILVDVSKYRGIDVPRRLALQAEWNRPVIVPSLLFLIVAIAGAVPAVSTVTRRRNRRVRRPAPGGHK